jgi:hypothetical protein
MSHKRKLTYRIFNPDYERIIYHSDGSISYLNYRNAKTFKRALSLARGMGAYTEIERIFLRGKNAGMEQVFVLE